MPNDLPRELLINGPVGHIELFIDTPAQPAKGIVLVSHPQPLLGGSPRHVVPLTLARHLCADGWLVVRPGFRGVGNSAGTYADGQGETQDSLAVVEYFKGRYPDLPLSLVGFSFGAHVFAQAACAVSQPLHAVALLGLPVAEVPGGRYYQPLPLPADCLLLHGELDEMAPLANLLDWARPDQRPVTVFAGANHFFKGCLSVAAEQVARHLNGALSSSAQ